MRSLLWILMFVVGLLGVISPVTYLYFASKLPQLESDFDLERLLRGMVESERLSERAAQAGGNRRAVTWQRPEYDRLPHDLASLYLSEMGCPAFLQTPRESTWRASWRAFNGFFLNRGLPGMEGGCEARLAARIALDAGVVERGPHAVATLRIRNFLTKDQLIAYAMDSFPFETGVSGVEDGALSLFHRPLKELDLSQLAVMALAMPPNGYYAELKSCENPALIRRARDQVLDRVANVGMVPVDRARAAQARPILCGRE